MADLQDRFESDLRELEEKLDANLETIIKRIAFELFTRIVRKTPVDTGRARSSWNIGVGRPVDRISTSGSQQGKAIRFLSRTVGFKKVYVTNALRYIRFLEDGSSRQAPRGMVRVSIAEVRRGLRQIVRNL